MISKKDNNMSFSAAKLLDKYPDKVPIILQKHDKCTLPDLPNRKFLVPRDLSVAQFIYTIRKRIQLPPSQAIYLFFGNALPTSSETMGAMWEKFRNADDRVLYGTYTAECTFG